jgi:hypothetical protein
VTIKFSFNFSTWQNIILYIFLKFSLQYAINFEFCQNMQKYVITFKYVEICKKKKFTISFKLWWFMKITDKNPKILKGKKYAIA